MARSKLTSTCESNSTLVHADEKVSNFRQRIVDARRRAEIMREVDDREFQDIRDNDFHRMMVSNTGTL